MEARVELGECRPEVSSLSQAGYNQIDLEGIVKLELIGNSGNTAYIQFDKNSYKKTFPLQNGQRESWDPGANRVFGKHKMYIHFGDATTTGDVLVKAFYHES